MKDEDKRREQLMNELEEMRRRVFELEAVDTERQRAEEALRESEGRLSSMLSSMVDLVFAFDNEGRFNFYHSPHTGDLYLPPEEFIGKNHSEVMPPHLNEVFVEAFEKNKRGEVSDFEYWLEMGGRVRWFSAKLSPVFLEGEFTGSVAVVREITERRWAEEALQRKTHQQEQLLETARYLTASLDFKEVLTRIAMEAQEILEAHGCTIYLLEPDGKTLTPVVAIEPPHEEEILSTPLDVETSFTGQAIKTRQALVFNQAAANSLGQQIPGTPVEEEERVIVAPLIVDGEVLGAMCLSRIGTFFSQEDLALAETFATYAVTALKNAQTHDVLQREVEERKRAEEALRESEARYRAVIEDQMELICRFLPDGTLTFVNEAYCRYFGKRREELIGHTCMPLIPEEDREFVMSQFTSLSMENPIVTYEHRVVAASEEIRWQQWTDRAIFDEQDRIVEYQSVGRDVTERKRAEEEIQRRTAQLEALRQMGLDLTAQLDLDALLHSIASQAVELLGGTAGGLYLYRPERGVLECAVPIGFDPATIGITLHRGEGLAGKVWETGEPLIVDDYHHWEGRANDWEDYPLTAVMGVPVRWGEEFLGVLEVAAALPRTFSPADAELLSLFANQATIAIENARLYEEVRGHADKLTVLYDTGKDITSTLELDALLQLVAERSARLTGADKSLILLVDTETEKLTEAVGFGFAPGQTADFTYQEVQDGISGLVLRERTPVISEDVLTDPQNTGLALEMARKEPERGKSIAVAPLLIKDKVIGTLTVINNVGKPVFSQADLDLVVMLASQAAIAIENARLYEAEREQRELAESLEEAAAVVSSTLDSDQVLDRILERVSRVVPNDAANIMLIEGDQARVVRWRGYERFGTEKSVPTVVFRIPETPTFRQMVGSKEPVVIPDTATHPGWVRVPVTEWLQSYAAAPIIVRGEVIGFLNVDSATPGSFTQADAEALRVFTDHAATAIENARLYEAERRHSAELETLREASLHLISSLDLQPILEAILDHAFKLVSAHDVHIFLYDGERLTFGAALWGDGSQREPYAEPRPHGLTYTVARSGERIVVPDVNNHPLFGDYRWGGSIVGLPLRIGQRVVGVMTIAFKKPRAFDEGGLRVLGLLADQAAIAIENARLYEESRRRALEQETLREAALALTTALDRNKVIDRILGQLQQVVPYDSASVQLLREDRMELVGGRGFPNLPDLLGISFPADGDNPNSEVIRTRAPFIVEDAPSMYEGFEKDPHRRTVIRSWLGVPMLIGEQLVGMIALDKSEPGFYTHEHARLAEAFAAQAAVAIENARLYEETHRQSDRLAQTLAASELLHRDLELEQLLDQIAQGTVRLGFRRAVINVCQPGEEWVKVRAMAGLEESEREALAGATYRWSDFQALMQDRFQISRSYLVRHEEVDWEEDLHNIVIIPDREDRGPGYWHPADMLLVPLRDSRGEPVGLLSVDEPVNDLLPDLNTVQTLEAFANQAAIAIENARLFEETERWKAFNESVVQGVAEAILIEDAEGIFTFANPAAEKLLGYTREELIGLHWSVIISEDQREKVRQETARRFRGTVSRYETALLNKEGRVIPVIVGARPLFEEGKFVGILSAFTDITGRKRVEEVLRRRNRELTTLYDAATTISSDLTLDIVLRAVAEQMTQALDSSGCALSLWDREQNLLETLVNYNKGYPDKTDPAGTTYDVSNYSAKRRVLETGQPIAIQHDDPTAGEAELALMEKWGTLTLLILPLIAHDRVVGLIELVDDMGAREYTREQIRLAESLAAQAAIAIENARLFQEIEERRMYLEGVLGAAPDAIVTLDAHHRIVEWNSGAERLFGYSREEVVGQNLDDLVTNPDVFEGAVELTQVVVSGLEVPPTETVRYRKDGSPVHVIVAGSPILAGDKLIGVVAVYTDITMRKRMEEALRAMALVDDLTGLYNRRGFFTMSQQQLKMADRTKIRMVLLFADFDHLKHINDTLGHSEGDRALMEVADVFKETFRESDIIARIGGDEFVVLAIETDSISPEILATRLRKNLEARNARVDRCYRLSLSMGTARYDPERPSSIDEMLAQADRAMYERKRGNQK